MTTENIKEIFSGYLKKSNTQYAIMINGGWGSGKTFFWTKVLSPLATAQGYKSIYISLNGIGKIEALDHQMFLKLWPLIDEQENKVIKNITTLFGNIANKLSTRYLNTSVTEIFKGVSIDAFDFKKYVICFDDLERCQIPIKEVLGFMNNYVEHKHVKTILLADETKMDTSTTGYNSIKEKLISRVLSFQLDITDILPGLFGKYESSNTEFHCFLVSNQKMLTDILVRYKQNNLRIINFYLEILEALCPYCKAIDQGFVEELILFSAIICIEFKAGQLTSSDYADYKGVDNIDHYYQMNSLQRAMSRSDKEKEEKEPTYADIFFKKYVDSEDRTKYIFYPSVYSFILSGYLNTDALTLELKGRLQEVLTPEIENFRKLLDYKFRALSNEEFDRLSKELWADAVAGKYFLYDYAQIAGFYFFFSNHKLVDLTVTEIHHGLQQGLDIVKERAQINDHSMENLLHFADHNPEVTKTKQAIKAIHNEIKKKQHRIESEQFLDIIRNGDEAAMDKVFQDNKFSKELFPLTDSQKLYEALMASSNGQLFWFTENLHARYHISNIKEFLSDDLICLTNIQNELAAYHAATDKLGQPRKMLIETLLTELDIAIQRLS